MGRTRCPETELVQDRCARGLWLRLKRELGMGFEGTWPELWAAGAGKVLSHQQAAGMGPPEGDTAVSPSPGDAPGAHVPPGAPPDGQDPV